VTLPTMPPDAAQRPADVRLASIMERLDRVERRLEETDREPEANPSRVDD
jgi:hypothetical protein